MLPVLLLVISLVHLVATDTLYFKPLRADSKLCGGSEQQTCPYSDTCCPLGGGQYNCCTFNKAVCCPDKLHCCPSKSTCDVKHQRCLMADGTIVAWQQRTQVRPLGGVRAVGSIDDIVCPGGHLRCHGNQSCCQSADKFSRNWGCCPYPKGVCCSDGKHCCPLSYKCDETYQFCLQGSTMMPWADIAFNSSAQATQPENVCSGGKWGCSGDSACCSRQGGGYNCCPFPRGTCCVDGVHCCPAAYVCDVQAGKCKKAKTLSVPLGVTKQAFLVQKPEAGVDILPLYRIEQKTSVLKFQHMTLVKTVCPDKKSECPAGTTCCPKKGGEYGCCPLKKAVCCADGKHCCPHGSRCIVPLCIKGGSIVPAWRKLPSRPVVSAAATLQPKKSAPNVICPDHQSKCSDNSTCCMLISGQYGCCPMKKAVCCSDHQHCCPEGTTCNVKHMTCDKPSSQPASIRRRTSAAPVTKPPLSANRHLCPGKAGTCADTETCCLLESGKYGCCPYVRATCCSDHRTCCPEHTVCGPGMTCKSSPVPQTRLILTTPQGSDIECPDKSKCPDKTTCCQMQSGLYGCCPIEKAVCCSDHQHCCPEGTTCNVKHKTCDKPSSQSAFIRQRTSAAAAVTKPPLSPNRHLCPDKAGTCADTETCCLLESGKYGCCPYVRATCCSDHRTCCPEHTVCGPGMTCKSSPVPQTRLILTTSQGSDVECPDKSKCPDKTTCCQMQSGLYGCCPIEKAICCSDHLHCCHPYQTCDVKKGECVGRTDAIRTPWHHKLPAKRPSDHIVCPDRRSWCPDQYTCCPMRGSTRYACCPLTQAVCCEDRKHCCPAGYQCDTAAGRCHSADGRSVPAVVKVPSLTSGQCPADQTLCTAGDDGDWCCPNEQGVCCPGMKKCCPQNSICHEGTCLSLKDVTPWTTVLDKSSFVVCPGGRVQCRYGQTCCQQKSGAYGCCPLAQAVCCTDGVHCCPRGTTCDLKHARCASGKTWALVVRAFTNEAATIKCPGTSFECPGGTTCCKKTSGLYGCCPHPNAVCCDDGVHCCAQGNRCLQGKCHPVLSPPVGDRHGTQVICPGGQRVCPSHSTCCLLRHSEWGCCPLPMAVCCNDGIHCCPRHFICNPESTRCIQKRRDGQITASVEMLAILPASNKP